MIACKRFHPKAILPTRGSLGAGGYDIYLPRSVVLFRGAGPDIFDTGIGIQIPEGYVGKCWSRSGHFVRHFIIGSHAGVIDSDYRGLLNLIVINLGKEDFVVKRGYRLAQMVIREVTRAEFEEVEELTETERAHGGFGHTGK